MTRTTARQIAIQLSFAAVATGENANNVCDEFFSKEHYETLATENDIYSDYPNNSQYEYICKLTELIEKNRVVLDGYINKYSVGWRLERISKTASAILRCAMCEILYLDDIPNAAAINEAVELAKKYDEPETVAFINGILGNFVKGEIEEGKI